MTIEVGKKIWVPCEVKPGPFPDERMFRVKLESEEWLGFVPVKFLKDSIDQGKTFIEAIVVSVGNGSFTAQFPGHSVTSSQFQGSVERAVPVGAF